MIKLYEHNQRAYEAVLDILVEAGKAVVIHPTGTGKSFIAFKLVEDHPNEHFVWLSPSENIYRTQLENTGETFPNIQFITYAKLMNMENAKIETLNPDFIIMDELHRCGAPMWQRGVERLLEAYPNAQLLGLTATPIRYLDNQRDMSQELFDGCVADEMTLGEAIATGILPAPKYVTTLYKYTLNEQAYKKRITRASAAVRERAEKYLERLRRALEKSDGLDVVFKKHLVKGKYICFCAGLDHLNEMVDKVHEWFTGIDAEPHVYKVWADSSSADADFAEFKKDESDHLRLLFCIDMFNEGIHVDNLDGVILFRPTISPIIYKQQIGRALSALKHGIPIIIDAVDNFENLYSISAVRTEMKEAISYFREAGNESRVIEESFEIIDEVRECRELIEALEETLSLSWEAMFNLAKKYYEEYGNLDVPKTYRTVDDIPLGVWISVQRGIRKGTRGGNLNEHRINLLNSIGMVWDNSADAVWENGLAHAKDYKEANADLKVNFRYKSEDGYPLGQWISNQRYAYRMGRMSSERLEKLNRLGMVWNMSDEWFETGYRAAKSYASVNGNLMVPSKYIDETGFQLGIWLRSVIEKYQTGTLSEEQIKRMEDINISWNGKKKDQWDACFAEAEKYFNIYGNLAVTDEITVNGVSIRKWIYRQRANLREGKLSEEQKNKLESIGLTTKSRNKSWDDKYNEAYSYYQEHGNLNVPTKYISSSGMWLGRWLSRLRIDYKKGILSNDEIEKMNNIQMRWQII